MELSREARAAQFLEKLKALPDERPPLVEAVGKAMEEPGYVTEEKLRTAVYRLLDDMEDLGLLEGPDRA